MRSEVFDVADDEVGVDAIDDAARHNIFGEALKKSKTGQQIKKLKGPGRVESYKQAFNDIVEEYDDFIRTDSIEDKYSLQEVFLGLGLDEDELKDDNADLIQEHLDELVFDQRADIVGEAIAHFEDNPAGPTDADFDALYDYIAKNGYWQLLYRKITARAYREIIEAGETVPGTDPEVVTRLRMRSN